MVLGPEIASLVFWDLKSLQIPLVMDTAASKQLRTGTNKLHPPLIVNSALCIGVSLQFAPSSFPILYIFFSISFQIFLILGFWVSFSFFVLILYLTGLLCPFHVFFSFLFQIKSNQKYVFRTPPLPQYRKTDCLKRRLYLTINAPVL